MKKIICMFFISFSLLALNVNFGMNINMGDLEFSGNNSKYDYSDRTWGVYLEASERFGFFAFGAGFSYESGYELDGTYSSFNAMPIYGLIRLYLSSKESSSYIVLKGGIVEYSNEVNLSNMDRGEFYSGGFGFRVFEVLSLEALYSYRTTKIDKIKGESNMYSLNISYNLF